MTTPPASTPAGSGDIDVEHLDPFRLPRHVVPRRYDVLLRPSLDDATFDGRVAISIDVTQPTSTIVLNAIELDIDTCTLDGRPTTWTLEPDTERMVVRTAPLPEGSDVTLEIGFSGVLNDKLRGFYRSTYVDDDGVEQVIATTQMQSTDCRRAFPCWDEPEFKAVFGITLDVAEGLTAVSNGREVERTSGDGRSVIRFADTMVMSSYLVAFVVGRLEITDPVDVDGVPLRVVHVPGKGHLTDFGVQIGAFSLRWFQEYYGIPYPSDKLDLLALPDFAAGAMENLGCITFRETALLVDPATATQGELQNVADTVAHEVAHMWFGDLVTMRWWNGIWLNEAFATFMEVAACDAFRPAWERWTDFGLERTRAFEVDALTSTRPVEFEVRSPDDCEAMFDVLTYQKGGALLRMLEQHIGPEAFRAGVNHYLRTHAYANTETGDLWDALETATSAPVRRLMDSWIWQPGFPLVTASLDTGDDGTTRLRLDQRRFVLDAGDDASRADGAEPATWVVPVAIRNGDHELTVLLDSTTTEYVDLPDPAAVVVVNAGGHGFFRVAYDEQLRSRVTAPEALATLDTLERYNLVDDAWAASLAGQMSAVDLLDFLERFSAERDLAVWRAITVGLRGISRLVDGPALDALRERVRVLVTPALDELAEPAEDESDLVGTLRGLLFSTLGVLGRDPSVRARSRELFAASTRSSDVSPDDVHPELVAAATAVVAATGGPDDYDVMLDGFRTGRTAQDQLRHLYALAAFDSDELMQRTCALAMSREVKTQNAPFLLRQTMANRDHGTEAWAFVRDHWDEINERFPTNTIVRLIESITLLTEPETVDEIQRFFAAHPIEQARATMQQLLERQRVNRSFHERNADRLAAVLS